MRLKGISGKGMQRVARRAQIDDGDSLGHQNEIPVDGQDVDMWNASLDEIQRLLTEAASKLDALFEGGTAVSDLDDLVLELEDEKFSDADVERSMNLQRG